MVFANSINGSNNDFQNTSGTFEFANRVRYKDLAYVENIGIAYSGGTFTVQGADGSALSATNPGYIILPSNVNKGRLIKYQITANQTFVDSTGTPTISGNSFGVTVQSGASYNQDLPFYLYAVSNSSAGSPETAVNFMFSRMPACTSTPAAAKIAKTGSAVASTQGGFFSLGNVTVADYASSPCKMIGSFRMRSTTNVASWTVQALSLTDGIGQFQESTIFTQVTGAFGAAANLCFISSGGTPPGFGSLVHQFYIDPFTSRQYIQASANTCNSSGVGASALSLATPYQYSPFGGSIAWGYLLNPGSSGFPVLGSANAPNGVTFTLTAPLAATYGFMVNTNFSSAASTAYFITADAYILNS